MKINKISIIGIGNIGTALLKGIQKNSLLKNSAITVSRRNLSSLQDFSSQGIQITKDNKEAIKSADLIFLAVKPKQLPEILHEIKRSVRKNQLIVSLVSGVGIESIKKILGKRMIIFRAMPNTALSICQSMTCISRNDSDKSYDDTMLGFFEKLGKAVIINEELMNASTVLGACGIAFCLRYIRAASQGGIEIGFDSETSQLIVAQTAKGAADMLLAEFNHPEAEIDKVTTPQGCTIAGINEMEHQGFSSALIKGITTSFGKL